MRGVDLPASGAPGSRESTWNGMEMWVYGPHLNWGHLRLQASEWSSAGAAGGLVTGLEFQMELW